MGEVYGVAVDLRIGARRVQSNIRCLTHSEAVVVAEEVQRLSRPISRILGARAGTASLEELTAHWCREWIDLAERAGAGPPMLALSGVDAAMWRLLAPTAERNSAQRIATAVYWSGFWLDSNEEVLRAEAAWVRSAGFDAMKMRYGAGDLVTDRARFETVAAQTGDLMVALDAVELADATQVRKFADEVDMSRLLWFEDPLPHRTPAATNALTMQVPIRIASGEACWGISELRTYLARSSIAVPILDMGRLGGPTALHWFLEECGDQYTDVGVHLDARDAAMVCATARAPVRLWLEVMGWWENWVPSPRKPGETAHAWVARCALPRPIEAVENRG